MQRPAEEKCILWSVKQWQEACVSEEKQIEGALTKVYTAKLIYDRFDSLMELINVCSKIPAESAEYKNSQVLKQQALTFAIAIVDAKNSEDLYQKAGERENQKKSDPHFMPWNKPAILSQPAIKHLKEAKSVIKQKVKRIRNITSAHIDYDELHSVTYCDEYEREKFRILPAQGKFKKISLSEENLILENFDTRGVGSGDEVDRMMCVVSPQGDIFSSQTIEKSFHHSSFLAADYTAFAGTIKVVDGILLWIDDRSGHYETKNLQLYQTLEMLRKCGILTEGQHIGRTEILEGKVIGILRKSKSLDLLSPEYVNRKKLNFLSKLSALEEKEQHDIRKQAIQKYIHACEVKFSHKLESALPAFIKVDKVAKEMLKLMSEKDYPIIQAAYDSVLKSGNDSAFKHLFNQALSNNKDLAVIFIKSGMDVNTVFADTQSTPLLEAIRMLDVDLVKLIAEKADVNKVVSTREGDITALVDACEEWFRSSLSGGIAPEKEEKLSAIITSLLDAGADPFTKSEFDKNSTLSQIAKSSSCPKLAGLLEKYEKNKYKPVI